MWLGGRVGGVQVWLDGGIGYIQAWLGAAITLQLCCGGGRGAPVPTARDMTSVHGTVWL